jgi:hypothetical protein
MKVMAVGPKRPLTPQQRQKYLPTEVPNTLKLYLDGKIEQFWYRQNSAGGRRDFPDERRVARRGQSHPFGRSLLRL